MSCRIGNSSFHGKIKEIPGISVDNFNNLESRAYFLSHCHSDHTEGLFSNQFLEAVKRNNTFIYMSEITSSIIVKNSKELQKYIIHLKIGSTDLTLPKMFDYEEQYINVTAIPAGHCFGSIMFLFQTNTQTILYTGDFRIKENDVCKLGQLHDNRNNPVKIDVLYVDTTFIDEKYRTFPKRNACLEELSNIIKDWLNEDADNAVALNTPAKFGYEFVFNAISKMLNCKIYVDNEKYKYYKDYPNQVRGITNIESETKIHVCSTTRETKKHDYCLTAYKKKFLSIRLTAMKWNNYDIEESPIDRVSENKIYACFPTHCSRSELIYFVNYLAAKEVHGFPSEYKEDNNNESNSCNVKKVLAKRKAPKRERIEVKKCDNKVAKIMLEEMFSHLAKC